MLLKLAVDDKLLRVLIWPLKLIPNDTKPTTKFFKLVSEFINHS